MKVLITGAAGFLGSRFADWLTANQPSVEIVGIDDLSGGYIGNVNPSVSLLQMNIVDDPIENVFATNQFDYVFHFAAYAPETLSPFIREYNYKNNLLATAKIVNNCLNHNIGRLIFSSATAVYGRGYGHPYDELQACNPIDPYGVAKYASEEDIQIAGEQQGLDYCILRLYNLYGAKQNIWDRYRNIFGIWMYQYLNNQPRTIFGDGSHIRRFSFIDDYLESIWKAATQANCSKQIINLGSSTPITINEANTAFNQIVGTSPIVYKEPRFEIEDSYPDIEKSISLFGSINETSLTTGLTQMWTWAQQQPSRSLSPSPQYETTNGLYPDWAN